MIASAPLLNSLLALQGAAAPHISYTPLLIQVAAIIGILYFLMIKPQQKQRREHEAQLSALKRGDEVVTSGGVIGEVIHIREAMRKDKRVMMEDRVTIKSAESRLIVERGRIARVVAPGTAPTTANAAGAANS
jgi:preprotein translocase subunit YajC